MWDAYISLYLKNEGKIDELELYISKAFEDRLEFKKESSGDHGEVNQCSSSKCFEKVDPKFKFCQTCGTK